MWSILVSTMLNYSDVSGGRKWDIIVKFKN